MYSSYGSYGSGYGSSYGSGSYGGGYGNYGAYGSNRFAQPNNNVNQNPNGNPEGNPPNNPRRNVMEEYFKMMGGLRSMVEIGFSLVALGNFASQSWKLLKRVMGFLLKMSKSLASKISGMTVVNETMSAAFEKAMLISPNSKNAYTLKNKLFMGLRIAAAMVLILCFKQRRHIEKETQKQHEQILKQYEDIKMEEQQLEHNSQDWDKGHQKEGYF